MQINSDILLRCASQNPGYLRHYAHIRMKSYLKYTALFVSLAIVGFYAFHIIFVLYEEVRVRETVEEIFANNSYEDISLSVCHESTCIYDFGEGKERVKIYTVGREKIASRIEKVREVAREWPNKNHLCKTFYQKRCQL